MLSHCIALEEKMKGKLAFPSYIQPVMYCGCENTCDLADCYFVGKNPNQPAAWPWSVFRRTLSVKNQGSCSTLERGFAVKNKLATICVTSR